MSASWARTQLGDLLTRSDETAVLEPDREYREITVKLWGKGVTLRGVVTGTGIAAQRRYVARSGQFILSRIDARNGALGIVPTELDGAVVTNDFPVFDVREDRLLPEYLGWMCRTRAFVEECKKASEGTTNRVRLQEGTFLEREIPLPPLAEQRRVVARIEELARRIQEARTLRCDAVEEAHALLEQGRATVFKSAFRGAVVRLDELATLERGKFSHRPRNEPRFFGGSHPWIQIAEIERSKKFIREWSSTLNDDGLAISKKFPKGTVLISIAATIGATGILTFDCCVPDSIVGVTPRDGTDSEFLYHYLGYVRTHLESIAPQSAQKNINLQILEPLPAPKISLPEQHEIVSYLDSLQGQLETLGRVHAETGAELDALLPSILDRAFRGLL